MTSIQTSRTLASFSLAVVMSAVSAASMAQVMVNRPGFCGGSNL